MNSDNTEKKRREKREQEKLINSLNLYNKNKLTKAPSEVSTAPSPTILIVPFRGRSPQKISDD